MASNEGGQNRREFLRNGLRLLGLAAVGGVLTGIGSRTLASPTVWQIDPAKCVFCGQCATACVLTPSAAKCVHAYAMCGYCNLCFGYYRDQRSDNGVGAENLRCPTDAIERTFVDDPYYQYVINEEKCIGCSLCVKGCTAYGNGSLFLQIRHDRCVNCNQCSIATICPSQAIIRIPAAKPYIIKTR